MYEQHGRFPNGLSFDEQPEKLWDEMKVMQRMIVWELAKAQGGVDGNWLTSDEDEELETSETEQEPAPLTLDML